MPPLPEPTGYMAHDYHLKAWGERDLRAYATQALAERDAEITRLKAELDEEQELRERMRDILRRVAVALRGPEPALTRWSWHDLPERAAAAVAAIDVMRRTAQMVAEAVQEPADVLAEYQGDGARQCVTVVAWLRPGERIVHVGGTCQGILDRHEGGDRE